MNIEKALRDIATGIDATMCPNSCPCMDGCSVMSDEECHDRIVAWLKEMMVTELPEEESY